MDGHDDEASQKTLTAVADVSALLYPGRTQVVGAYVLAVKDADAGGDVRGAAKGGKKKGARWCKVGGFCLLGGLLRCLFVCLFLV